MTAVTRWPLAIVATMRIVAAVVALLCVLSTLAGCGRLAQPGSLPSDQERCANAGGSWSGPGALCRYKGQ